jgi:hypothetical protein
VASIRRSILIIGWRRPPASRVRRTAVRTRLSPAWPGEVLRLAGGSACGRMFGGLGAGARTGPCPRHLLDTQKWQVLIA